MLRSGACSEGVVAGESDILFAFLGEGISATPRVWLDSYVMRVRDDDGRAMEGRVKGAVSNNCGVDVGACMRQL